MNKLTVLLTGATGFLGSNLLESLLKSGFKVVILKRSTSNLWRIQPWLDYIKSYDIDVQPLTLPFEEQRVDCVIHTACNYGRNGDSLDEIVSSNLMFGLKLLDVAITNQVNTFINSDSLLPRELNAYSLSKKQFVDWLRQYSSKIQVVNLRIEHMYGPKDDSSKFLPWIISQLKENVPEIKLTKGEQQRDFVYIDDVVSAFSEVLKNLNDLGAYSEFDVGTGELVTIKEFLEQLRQSYEAKFGISNTAFTFGALPYRDGELMTVNVINQTLLDLGWEPKTNLKQGLDNSLKEIQ